MDRSSARPLTFQKGCFDKWNAASEYVLETIWNEETTMLIGYARTSTLEQEAGLEAQFRDLQALGCEKVIKEQTSSVGPRRGLEEAMESCPFG